MQYQIKSSSLLRSVIVIKVMSFLCFGSIHSQSIAGQSNSDIGVSGESTSNLGVYGYSTTSNGVYGLSNTKFGVRAVSVSNYALDVYSDRFHGASFEGDKDNGYVDIILRASSNTGTGDNGTIMSDPNKTGSDIFMVANDAVVAKLDNIKDGTGNFLVYNGDNTTIFRVDINGNVSAQGSTFNGSDRNRKEQISDVSYSSILQSIKEMPIYEWQYKGQDRRHIGPMAQDFHKAFGLGDDDKTIATIDADGVALAAIKAQQEIIEKQAIEISSLKQRVDEMELMKDEITILKGMITEKKD